MIFAIDPGTTESAWVEYDPKTRAVVGHAKQANDDLFALLAHTGATHCAIEMVASYGMAVGAEVFHTVLWAGRFYEAARRAGLIVRLIYRKQVTLHICHSATAGDANVCAALKDLYGGRAASVGTTKARGPLYGLKGDEWQALAVALTAAETQDPAPTTNPAYPPGRPQDCAGGVGWQNVAGTTLDGNGRPQIESKRGAT